MSFETNVNLQVVALCMSSAWARVETQEDVDDLGRNFSFPAELHDAVRNAMQLAAEYDAMERLESGVDIPDDPAARWGKWHRAANKVNFYSKKWARENDISLGQGDWSWRALLKVVGVSL